MDERLDAQISVAATVFIVVLLLGQVVLLAAHLWAPMARTADRLIVDENAPLGDEPGVGEGRTTESGEPTPDPWRWVALAMTVFSAGTAVFAAWRLRQGTAERNRWMTVLVVGALGVAWGVFTFRLIARSAIIFEGF